MKHIKDILKESILDGGLDTYEVCPELEWLYDYMNS